MAHRPSTSRWQPLAPKVPEITPWFWIVKILTTAMGEATADYLAAHSLPLAAFVGFAGFGIAMWLQLRARRYAAPTYWFAVMMVAVLGTMGADGMHIALHVPYFASTAFFAVAAAILFVVWYRTERTLSIHSIVTTRREVFYWMTIVATFALGTATGDFTAQTLGLGYFTSLLVFAVLILMPWIAYRRFRLAEVVAFWWAYVLTRPLGASMADWLGKPRSITGLGLGDGPVALVTLALIAAFVWYLASAKPDIQPAVATESA